jgi:hypothetical protein
MSVLLPALGKPTSATSATSFSSRSYQCSSPTSPCSANDGARRRLDRNRALPRPPRPPAAATQRSPGRDRSATTVPSRSFTTVPTGTLTSVDDPVAPWRALPCPWAPLAARRCGWSLKASREATLGSATNHTSPPSPPSPPSGPPLATCASRRNDTAPAPPPPAFTWSWASSTKFISPSQAELARRTDGAPPGRRGRAHPPAGRAPSLVDLALAPWAPFLRPRRRGGRRRACGPCGSRT